MIPEAKFPQCCKTLDALNARILMALEPEISRKSLAKLPAYMIGDTHSIPHQELTPMRFRAPMLVDLGHQDRHRCYRQRHHHRSNGLRGVVQGRHLQRLLHRRHRHHRPTEALLLNHPGRNQDSSRLAGCLHRYQLMQRHRPGSRHFRREPHRHLGLLHVPSQFIFAGDFARLPPSEHSRTFPFR